MLEQAKGEIATHLAVLLGVSKADGVLQTSKMGWRVQAWEAVAGRQAGCSRHTFKEWPFPEE